MLVSIIVPVYNTAPWLRRCLDSICSQTYDKLEIVCVNDGSTDNSAEILQEYAARDARIRVFTQPNAGLSAARNTALEHATGEWVLGVDSDDYLASDTVALAMARVSAEVDAVFIGVRLVDETGVDLPDEEEYFALPEGYKQFSPELALRLNVCFWSKLWRRSVIEAHGLRCPHGLLHEDEGFHYIAAPWLRQVAFCPAAHYYYVQRGGSIMHSRRSSLESARVYVKVLGFVRERLWPQHKEYYLCMLWRIYKQSFHHALRGESVALAEIFRSAVPLDVECSDYRVACLTRTSTSWVRYEPLRKIYCLFGVPVMAREFDGLRYSGWQFSLWRAVRCRLGLG